MNYSRGRAHAKNYRAWSEKSGSGTNRHARMSALVRFRGDSVAKVVLQEMSKILRAAGAFFV